MPLRGFGQRHPGPRAILMVRRSRQDSSQPMLASFRSTSSRALPEPAVRMGALKFPVLFRVWRSRTARVAVASASLLLVTLATLQHCSSATHASATFRDASLSRLPLYLYRTAGPPRAWVFFFGNDVGFWAPHEALAERLAAAGYAVAGFDVKQWLETLPAEQHARETAFVALLPDIMARTRRELDAQEAPLVIAGHSIGAEIALWTAVNATPESLAGVLALSPGMRGHLRATLSDLAEQEPVEQGSFSVAQVIRELPLAIRVAVIRGANDRFASGDSALQRSGGTRLRRFVVPLAGHSLKHLILAGPIVLGAMQFLLPTEGASSASFTGATPRGRSARQ